MWRNRTTGAFDCAQFEGGHFYLASDKGQRWVMERIDETLGKITKR